MGASTFRPARSLVFMLCLLCLFLQQKLQAQLVNYGNLRTFSGNTLCLKGDFVNNGTVTDSGDVIILNGTAVQSLGGSASTIIKNLALTNSAGAALTSTFSIRKELTISAGTFSANNHPLILLSDVNGTARIAPILGNFSGSVTMERYIGSGGTGWRFLASPVTGATIADWQDDFITSGFPGATYPNYNFASIYTYDETVAGNLDQGFLAATGATAALTPGDGYWCYVGPTPVKVDVTGPPAKFNQSFNVSYTSSGGSNNDGWVMIGNPYPAPINWSSTSWTKSNVNDAVYIWNPGMQQYASWVNGTGTNGGNNVIASSQSFWIQTNGANPVLSCNENVKHSSNAPFLMVAPQNTFASVNIKLAGPHLRDETYIRFGNASHFYDKEHDARKLKSTNPAAPFVSSTDSSFTDMSINSLPLGRNRIKVPVKTLVGSSGTYTIKVSDEGTVPPGTCLFVEDLLTGTLISLNSEYTFFISDTTKAPRFVLHAKMAGSIEAKDASCYNRNDGMAIVLASGEGPFQYVWKNNSGDVLRQSNNSATSDTLKNISAGNYFVIVQSEDLQCKSDSQLIVVSQPAPVTASFTILNNNQLMPGDTVRVHNYSTGTNNFVWKCSNGILKLAGAEPLFLINKEGHHQIQLVAGSFGCADSLSRTIDGGMIYQNAESQADLENVTVYPNPARGVVYISGLSAEGAVLEILTLTGVRIYKDKIESDMKTDIGGVSKGLYLYTIRVPGRPATSGKLILE